MHSLTRLSTDAICQLARTYSPLKNARNIIGNKYTVGVVGERVSDGRIPPNVSISGTNSQHT